MLACNFWFYSLSISQLLNGYIAIAAIFTDLSNTTSAYNKVRGWGWWGGTKWQVEIPSNWKSALYISQPQQPVMWWCTASSLQNISMEQLKTTHPFTSERPQKQVTVPIPSWSINLCVQLLCDGESVLCRFVCGIRQLLPNPFTLCWYQSFHWDQTETSTLQDVYSTNILTLCYCLCPG